MNKHKTALITGASGGIGKALAFEMASNGHDLILVARNRERLESVMKDIEEQHYVDVAIYQQDLSIPGAALELFQKIDHDRIRIDMLINNAGIGDYGSFQKTDREKLIAMITLNITALTELTHLVLPQMLERGEGRIMNVASTAAFMPGPLMATYFATKAYVLHFSEAIGNELKSSGVTVTTLCPGATATGFQKGAKMSGTLFKGSIPTAQDVARFGYRAMMRGTPVAVHGRMNKLMTFLVRLTPRKLVPKIARSFLQ